MFNVQHPTMQPIRRLPVIPRYGFQDVAGSVVPLPGSLEFTPDNQPSSRRETGARRLFGGTGPIGHIVRGSVGSSSEDHGIYNPQMVQSKYVNGQSYSTPEMKYWARTLVEGFTGTKRSEAVEALQQHNIRTIRYR